MLNWELLIAFVPVALAVVVVPGPTLALITLNTAQKGRRSGMHTVLGVAVGKAALVLAVVAVLSTILSIVEVYGDWIRWLGASYILVAAVRAWRSADFQSSKDNPVNGSHLGAFFQGLIAAATSPITILFLATQMPIFIDPGVSAVPQLILLGSSYILLTLCIEMLCVSLIVKTLRSREQSLTCRITPKGSAVCLIMVAALVSPLSASVGV